MPFQNAMSTTVESLSPTPTTTSGTDEYSGSLRERRAPLDHASQLGAISDVTDDEEEGR